MFTILQVIPYYHFNLNVTIVKTKIGSKKCLEYSLDQVHLFKLIMDVNYKNNQIVHAMLDFKIELELSIDERDILAESGDFNFLLRETQ